MTAVDRLVADAAFGAFVTSHRAAALRLAWLLTGDPHEAEDVVADALAGLWVRWTAGEVVDAGAYLRTSVVNRSRSVWRRRLVRRRHAQRRRGDGRGEPTVGDQVADRDLFARGLARLPTRQRQVVVLRYYEGLSIAETATLLGVSESNVRATTSRALAALGPSLARARVRGEEVSHDRS